MFDSLFGKGAPAAEPATPATPATPPADPNAAAPATPPTQPPAAPAEPKSPLDNFANLFDTKGTGNQGTKQPIPTVKDIFTDDTVKGLTEKLDFVSMLSEDTKKGLADGDGKAFFAALNEVARGSYSQSLVHSSTVMEQLLQRHLDERDSSIGSHVRSSLVEQNISELTGDKGSPVLKAGLSMISEKLQAEYPDAQPDWIASQAAKFFKEFANALNPKEPSPEEKAKAEEVDWVKFANNDT